MITALDLRRRRCCPEVMDQPGLDPAVHRAALDGLARINGWSRSAAILWPPIRALAVRRGAPLRVLDLATGAADVPIALSRTAHELGYDIRFSACDASPTAIDYARERAAAAGVELDLFVARIGEEPLDGRFDVVMSSLFLHHLDEDGAVALLRTMAELADHLVLVNDLRRRWGSYLLTWLATRVLTSSEVVRNDGLRSVEAAWRIGEVRTLAEQAGLHGARIEPRFPARFLLSWSPA